MELKSGQAAYKKGYYLAFRPPTLLRMIHYNGGPVPKGLETQDLLLSLPFYKILISLLYNIL